MTHLICIDGLAFGNFINFIFLPIFCLLIDKTDIFLAWIRDHLTVDDPNWRPESASDRFLGLMRLMADVGGQYCPCPVLVLFLSGFPGKSFPVSAGFYQDFCPVSVSNLSGVSAVRRPPCPLSGVSAVRQCPLSGLCPEFHKKCCPMSVWLDFSCLDAVRCPDSVRILEKSCPLSVCPAGQGRDKAVWTFTALVRRCLVVGSLT